MPLAQHNPESCRKFEILWKKNRPFILGQCLFWNQGNHADAHEVLSTASIEVWKKLKDNHDVQSFKSWVKGLIRQHYHKKSKSN